MAFDRLVLKYRSQIVELAKRHRLNPADAEDVTQERSLGHMIFLLHTFLWRKHL